MSYFTDSLLGRRWAGYTWCRNMVQYRKLSFENHVLKTVLDKVQNKTKKKLQLQAHGRQAQLGRVLLSACLPEPGSCSRD